jgi:hypothetical protein
MINKKLFFDSVRDTLFKGELNQDQVRTMESFIDFYETYSGGAGRVININAFAYLLATVYHETAKTFLPIAEYGKGKGLKYGTPDPVTGKTYYGRGYVQLTWAYNYKKLGDMFGVDLLNNPELAMSHPIAMKILFSGMNHGLFTGKKLGDYFNVHTRDYLGARRIINGTDKAEQIANYAILFNQALKLT